MVDLCLLENETSVTRRDVVTRRRLHRARACFVIGVMPALLAAACMSGDGEAEEATDAAPVTAEAEPADLAPPEDVIAAADALSIAVSWATPSGEPEVDRYSVYRNGSFFRSIVAPATSFTDEDVAPGKTYTYEIEARAGELVSDRAAVEATVRTPPLRVARVQGTFNVRTKELSSSGYSDFAAGTMGWQFRPRCGQGACDVRWNDLQRKSVRAVFKRDGARYEGNYTGFFFVRCGNARVTSSLTIRFKVDAARAMGAEWRATRLLGTLNQSEAAQLGCVSSRARLSIRANLTG
jgi:hypothetical protein